MFHCRTEMYDTALPACGRRRPRALVLRRVLEQMPEFQPRAYRTVRNGPAVAKDGRNASKALV